MKVKGVNLEIRHKYFVQLIKYFKKMRFLCNLPQVKNIVADPIQLIMQRTMTACMVFQSNHTKIISVFKLPHYLNRISLNPSDSQKNRYYKYKRFRSLAKSKLPAADPKFCILLPQEPILRRLYKNTCFLCIDMVVLHLISRQAHISPAGIFHPCISVFFF